MKIKNNCLAKGLFVVAVVICFMLLPAGCFDGKAGGEITSGENTGATIAGTETRETSDSGSQGTDSNAQGTQNTAETSSEPDIQSLTVKTAEELYSAIGPDRIITLKPDRYILDTLAACVSASGGSSPAPEGTNPYVRPAKDSNGGYPDSFELVIKNVRNLSIVCIADEPAELLIGNQTADVLTFEDCENITLTNIRVGHWPEEGGCSGGVAVFINTSFIAIDRCSFFGCGINGLELRDVEDIEFSNSVIENCNFHIMSLANSSNITFRDSEFVNNRGCELINISGCQKVLFDGCSIADNIGVTDIGVLFMVDGGPSAYVEQFDRNNVVSDILVQNSSIINNTTVSGQIARYPDDSAGSLVFKDTVFEGNSFSSGPDPGE